MATDATTTEPTLKELKDQILQKMDGAVSKKDFDTAINDLKAKAAEMDKLGEIKDAVKQLEEDFKELGKSKASLVHAHTVAAFDRDGRWKGRYFDREDDARAFGLGVMAATGTSEQKSHAVEVLKAEHAAAHKAWSGEQKDFTTTDASAAIPEGFSNRLVRLVEEYGVFERNAMSYPMPEAKVRFPKRVSGILAYPVDEGVATQEQEVVLAPKVLDASKWGVHSFYSREAEEDSAIGIAELFAQEFALAFANAGDRAGFLGDGTATYAGITGVLNAVGSAAIVTASGNNWDAITEADIDKLISRLPTYAQNRAKFYCTNQFFWQVMVKFIEKGVASIVEHQDRRVLSYKGWPVEVVHVMPSVSAANQIPLVFGDLFMAAVFGTRRAFEIRRSEHFKFLQDLITVQALRRFDILIHSAGSASLVEAIVALKTVA